MVKVDQNRAGLHHSNQNLAVGEVVKKFVDDVSLRRDLNNVHILLLTRTQMILLNLPWVYDIYNNTWTFYDPWLHYPQYLRSRRLFWSAWILVFLILL